MRKCAILLLALMTLLVIAAILEHNDKGSQNREITALR